MTHLSRGNLMENNNKFKLKRNTNVKPANEHNK